MTLNDYQKAAERTSARATGADGGRNMTDCKKLCEDLRNLSHYDCEEAPFGTEKKIHEAANAIEKLQAELRKYENLEEQLSDECALRDEIAELKAENDKMRPFYTTADTHFKLWEKTAMDAYEERNRAKAELEKLQAKLDRVTLERDAASCDWCEGGACDLVWGDGFYAEIDNGELVVSNSFAAGEGRRKINFCPMCGKALEGEEEQDGV